MSVYPCSLARSSIFLLSEASNYSSFHPLTIQLIRLLTLVSSPNHKSVSLSERLSSFLLPACLSILLIARLSIGPHSPHNKMSIRPSTGGRSAYSPVRTHVDPSVCQHWVARRPYARPPAMNAKPFVPPHVRRQLVRISTRLPVRCPSLSLPAC